MFFNIRDINPKIVWKAKDTLKLCDSLIAEGFELEAKGRAIASARQEQITKEEDMIWFKGVAFWHINISEVVFNMWEVLKDTSEINLEDYDEILSIGQEAFYYCYDYSKHFIGKNRSDILSSFLPDYIFEKVISDMKKYDKVQYEFTGRKGIWLYGNIPDEKYSYSAYVNDMTSIFHQVLNYSIRIFQNVSVIVPERAYSYKSGNPYLEELIKSWWESVEVLDNQHLYTGDDYNALFALIKSNGVEVRVGSSEGHMTHIEFRLRGIVGTYYDIDEDVNRVFIRLLEYYGCDIVEHVEGEHVKFFCPRINNSDFKFMKAVLPFVTSMDFRVRDSGYWSSSEIWEQCKKLRESYSDEELEFRLCLIMGEKLLEGVSSQK